MEAHNCVHRQLRRLQHRCANSVTVLTHP